MQTDFFPYRLHVLILSVPALFWQELKTEKSSRRSLLGELTAMRQSTPQQGQCVAWHVVQPICLLQRTTANRADIPGKRESRDMPITRSAKGFPYLTSLYYSLPDNKMVTETPCVQRIARRYREKTRHKDSEPTRSVQH